MDTSVHEALLKAGMSSIAHLEETIKSASDAYYTTGKSPLTDAAWDAMVDLLRAVRPESPLLHKTGWGYSPDTAAVPGEKVKHLYGEVGSLDKAYAFNEINKEMLAPDAAPYELSPKLDGLSLVVYYIKGIRQRGVTRGDGFIGIDVTNKIAGLTPEKIWDSDFTGGVRGELTMPKANWEKYHADHPDAKNPRNTVAGLINAKEVSPDLKYVQWTVYTVVGVEEGLDSIKESCRASDLHRWLENNFVHCVPVMELTALTEARTKEFKMLLDLINPDDSQPTDGLVMKSQKIAFSGNDVIYNMQAWKFPAEQAETTVTEVEWNLSKTKYLIPRIITDTVFISGTNASAATGYNAAYIMDNNIGPGARIKVSKHGEIIPNVDEVLSPGDLSLPTVCPECGEPLSWEGVHLRCTNPQCTGGALKDILIWFECLVPMDNMGDKNRKKFLGYYLSTADITLEAIMRDKDEGFFDDLRQSASTSTAIKFIDNWAQLHNPSSRFDASQALMALNIPRLGDVTSNKLGKDAEFMKQLLLEVSTEGMIGNGRFSVGLEQMLLQRVGVATTASILAHPEKVMRLQYIADRIQVNASQQEIRQVAVTGSLSMPRAAFAEMIKPLGFVVSDLKASSFVLITDNPNSGSSKNTKADKWGIPKMTEMEFLEKYVQSSGESASEINTTPDLTEADFKAKFGKSKK